MRSGGPQRATHGAPPPVHSERTAQLPVHSDPSAQLPVHSEPSAPLRSRRCACCRWTAFLALTPPGHAGQYVGLFTFSMNVFFWVEQTVYGVVVEATNNHQYAFATASIWAVLGLLLLFTIDFEKGKREALKGKAGASNQDKI